MNNAIKAQFWAIVLSLNLSLQARPAENPRTFCNPLNLNYRFMVDAVDAREAADPVIVLFHDDYYLFASRSGGYWTSPDLRQWTLIIPSGLDVETYAPAVMVLRDSLFYIPSANGQIYKTADPKAGVWQKGPLVGSYGDPAFFVDEDERLYMFYGLSNATPTHAVELNPFTFKEIGSPINIVFAQASIHGWERRGDDNLLDEQPWIEGSWMIKNNGRYYLHYAGPGTEFKTYADGIYVADSPLGPYTYADYSPFSFKPTGFICGAGHGCTFMDKEGQYWHIGTMTISVKHMFERRLGLYPVGFDRDGQIYCNTVFGDYPQYLPGEFENMTDNSFAGMMLLSYNKKVMTSSSVADHAPEYAADEDARTYWSAQTGSSDEWLITDLGTACSIEAIQINFAEHNTTPEIVRGRDNLDILHEQYLIETSFDGLVWDMLVDKSQNLQDTPHDYIQLSQPVSARYLKLTNLFTPGNGAFAVRDFRIFGNSQQAIFSRVTDYTVERDPADGRDALLHWPPVTGADGYVIRYGIAPDKLYNNYMVYDAETVAIHSLNHGTEYYFDVQAFDNGTDSYIETGEYKSFQSGNYRDVDTWARHDGTDWVHPAPNPPTLDDGIITIQDGHVVTITIPDSADQLVIKTGATLVISQNVPFHVADGIATDLQVEGTVVNRGTITCGAQASISFQNSGLYSHEQDGGALPTALWRPNSTCRISSIKQNVPANANQNFHNVVWNCPEQTGNFDLGWNGNIINGDIIVENTGSGIWQMCAPPADHDAEVFIEGDIHQSGGQFTATASNLANTTVNIHQKGNIIVTGGNFAASRGLQGGNGQTIWNLQGDVSLSKAIVQNANSQGARFVIAGSDKTQHLVLTDVTYGDGGFPLEVNDGAVLDMGASTLAGNGSFHLKAGATLLSGHVDGIDGSLTNSGMRVLDQEANYGFIGGSAQTTGYLLPQTVNGFILDNETSISLSHSLTVNGFVRMAIGKLVLDGQELHYGPHGSLEYTGTAAQTTSDAEFPSSGGPHNLIINTARAVTLHSSRSLPGNLELNGELQLGTNTLTAGSTSHADERNYIDTADGGALALTSIGASSVLFPVGTTAYAPVWVTNAGAVDTISVGAIRDSGPAPFGGRITVKWNIHENTAGGGDYTLQFGWMNNLENPAFRNDRLGCAGIFNLTDTTEVGSGPYLINFDILPKTITRAGIVALGPFAVGRFSESTGIHELNLSPASEWALFQNYPNPFNPRTAIDFTLSHTSHVELIIFDILGREVVTLVNGKMEGGRHSVRWDAGERASGVYLYQLKTDQFVQIRKMLLIQ